MKKKLWTQAIEVLTNGLAKDPANAGMKSNLALAKEENDYTTGVKERPPQVCTTVCPQLFALS